MPVFKSELDKFQHERLSAGLHRFGDSLLTLNGAFGKMTNSTVKFNEKLGKVDIDAIKGFDFGKYEPVSVLTVQSKSFAGIQIIEDRFMVDYVEDWSKCRSPSRAKRRRKQGHAQHVFMRAVPKKEAYFIDGKVIIHPAIAAELQKQIQQTTDKFLDEAMNNLWSKFE